MARGKKKKPIQMASTTEGWYDDKKERLIPFADLSDEHLQNALIHAERRELQHFNVSSFFATLAEKIIAEAEKRGLELKHHKSWYIHQTHLQKRGLTVEDYERNNQISGSSSSERLSESRTEGKQSHKIPKVAVQNIQN